LGRTENFFGTLLSKEDIKENDKPPAVEVPKGPQVNGAALPFRADPKPRFSDPPAPPPQQPLPEKPDVARASPTDASSHSVLKKSDTAKSSTFGGSPTNPHSSQILSLVEALSSAKK